MNEVQVLVVRPDGYAAPIGQRLDDLQWSTSAPGGFGSATLFLPGDPQQIFAESGITYLSTIVIRGGGGGPLLPGAFQGQSDVLFEGRIEDMNVSLEEGHVGITIEAAGFQALTNEPYRAAPILKDVAQRIVNLPLTAANNRPGLITMNAGAGQALGAFATAGDENGMVLFVAASQAPPGIANALNYGQAEFPVRMTRAKFTMSMETLGSYNFAVVAHASFPATTTTLINVVGGNLAPTAHDVAIPSGYGNLVRWGMVQPGNISAATNSWIFINQPRVLSPRGPSGLDNEPVYGHELVQDVIFNSLLSQDSSNVDTDTTYQFGTADFSNPGTTLRNALDYITAFYDRYWAVWENKTLYWKPTVLTQAPDWQISARQGITYTLEPSIAEAARAVRVDYRDVQGINRSVTAADPRYDNVFTVAGASKTAQVALPVVSNASAAQQIANTYFPDHSYEVLRGVVTIPALTPVTTTKQGGGQLPAYKIRAGDSIRVTDIAQPRDFFSTQFDRKTILFIRSTNVDWEGQKITLEVDNTRDRMSTLLARIAANVQTRFPGT